MEVHNVSKTDVTVVNFIKEFIFVGIGGTLSKYNLNGTFLTSNQIFNGQKIYGIVANSINSLFIYGGTNMKLVSFTEITGNEKLFSHNDWILEAKWIEKENNIAIVSMKNTVSIHSVPDMHSIRSMRCIEKCILYSACLNYDTWDELIILCGTVFGEVLILWPSKFEKNGCSTVLHRIQGHNGVIFSVSYSLKLGIICTTSDDRSVRIWNVKSKDLQSEMLRSVISIECQHVLYGHSSRVWKNKILKNYIVTGGEDGQIFIWKLNGTVYKRFKTHQNGCIWSLDCHEDKNLILTGGSDCGVSLHSLKRESDQIVILLTSNEVPRLLVILQSGNLCVITENGMLMLYSLLKQKWVQVECFSDLKSYCLLEISTCRNLFALAGFRGNIYIFKEIQSNHEIVQVCSYTLPEKSRIYSLHWLSCNYVLTCGPDGTLSLLKISFQEDNSDQHSMQCISKFCLPASKERWTTSACFCSNKHLLVGDRKGNLHLFHLESSELVYSVWKAHNYLGVSKVIFGNNCVLSLGRNSTLNEYNYNSANETLTLVSKDKLPFKWLANFYQDKDDTLIIGFSGNNFYIWDQNNRRVLLDRHCGGGHRSWDFRKGDFSFNFAYIKDKVIHFSNHAWHNLKAIEIVEGFHTKEINTCKVVGLLNGAFLIVSGSEDTTIRISCLEYAEENFDFWNFQILKSHLSSIRSIFVLNFSISLPNCKEYLIFSAGGRAQLILWKLCINFENTNVSNISCKELDNMYEPSDYKGVETRIMCLASMHCEKEFFVLLIAACSDGKLKFYKISTRDSLKIIYIGSIFYKIKCILNVTFIQVQSKTVLISMATDGNLVFWDISAIIDGIKRDENNMHDLFKLFPFSILNCHQSGVNSFCFKEILFEENCFAFLTGGDDNKVNFCIATLNLNKDTFEKVHIRATYENYIVHCAQITGVFISEKYFVTTSIDQKLQIFSWKLNNSFNLEISCVHTYLTSVPDVKGLQCLTENEKEIIILIYGNGFDICRIKYF